MPEKPATALRYTAEQNQLVRATCLYLATILGDCIDDVVIVGGLVPSLLIDQDALPAGVDRHAGSMDLDIGLTLDIFEGKRYEAITARLRRAGFSPDESDQGNPTRQRWKIMEKGRKVTVDFLIPPANDSEAGGTIRDIEGDFAAVITPGLRLAFLDRKKVDLSGITIKGEKAKRSIWVCGPGALVVLKALAFRNRGEYKDAYDLYYHIRNYGGGVQDVADALKLLWGEVDVQLAFKILSEDFTVHDALGPIRIANFITGGKDDEIQADVVGFVLDLLGRCRTS